MNNEPTNDRAVVSRIVSIDDDLDTLAENLNKLEERISEILTDKSEIEDAPKEEIEAECNIDLRLQELQAKMQSIQTHVVRLTRRVRL